MTEQTGAAAQQEAFQFGPNIPALVRRAAGILVDNIAHKCGQKGCKAYSLGFKCTECDLFHCIDHTYLTASAPPKAVCLRCVAITYKETVTSLGAKKRKRKG